MIVYYFFRFVGIQILIYHNFNDIVYHNEAADDKALSNLKSVNSSINVDGVGTENCNVSHIEIINVT